VTGAAANAPIQITRVNPRAGEFSYEAEEQLYQIIDPEDLNNRTIIFDAAITDVDLRAVHDSLYPAPETGDTFTLRCYVETNVVVGSSSSTTPAFTVGAWPSGVTVFIYNSGRIQGAGGKGGRGVLPIAIDPGDPGGLAFYTRKAVTFDNTNGLIYGGGGGGGAGGSGKAGKYPGGGGGGAGFFAGLGGVANYPELNGKPGILDAGGAGGPAGSSQSGAGGNGGAPAQPGQPGGYINGAAGGAAGGAIDGNSYVTFTGEGDIRGTRVN
jgi:hypothetical protein